MSSSRLTLVFLLVLSLLFVILASTLAHADDTLMLRGEYGSLASEPVYALSSIVQNDSGITGNLDLVSGKCVYVSSLRLHLRELPLIV